MDFEDIYEYIKLTKEERQKHLDLNEECLEIGGYSLNFRGLLAHYLKTTIPSGNFIHLCHSCNNGKCSNVKHLYWGTASDNRQDTIEFTQKNIWEYSIDKYGLEKTLLMNKQNGFQLGNKFAVRNKNVSKSEVHRKRLSEANKGKKHYTDGKVNIHLNGDEIPPDGFKRGMTRFKKDHQKGEKNSQYGTMWITNGIESKKIKKTDQIPDGWKNGITRI